MVDLLREQKQQDMSVISDRRDAKLNGIELAGKTVAVSGSGNVAIYATQKAQELGAKL